MVADQAKAFLHISRDGIFHPEKAERFQVLAEPCRFHRFQAVMDIVQQVKIVAEGASDFIKQHRCETEVFFSVPDAFFGKLFPQGGFRSEEHTSELQSLMRISYAVFCLKKKKYNT